jgi:hypothetical protein
MKKSILVLLIFQLNSATNLFSQSKDSLELEMQRLDRLGDSLHKEQVARDSAFMEFLNESARKVNESIAEKKQKELESATREVMQRKEKEQKAKRKTMLLALSAFLIIIVAGGIIRKRIKKRN